VALGFAVYSRYTIPMEGGSIHTWSSYFISIDDDEIDSKPFHPMTDDRKAEGCPDPTLTRCPGKHLDSKASTAASTAATMNT